MRSHQGRSPKAGCRVRQPAPAFVRQATGRRFRSRCRPRAACARRTTRPRSIPARSEPTAAITATPEREARDHDPQSSPLRPAAPAGRGRRQENIITAHHPPIREPHRALAALRERRVVGDEQQGRAEPLAQREQQIHHHLPRRLIEIAGRFVGEQEPRFRREGAGEHHTLLLATRELRRQMGGAGGSNRPRRGPPPPAPRRPAHPQAPAAPTTFSSAVMVGMR